MQKPLFLVALVGALSVSAIASANAVVPNLYTNTFGSGTYLGPLVNGNRRFQTVIDSSQLTGLVDQKLKGIAYRAAPNVNTAWPAANLSYTQFDIYISAGVDPTQISTALDNNYAGAKTKVRAGSLQIAAGAYGVTGTPRAFGPTIQFDSAWTYTGGDLLIEVVQSGTSIATSLTLDAVTKTNGADPLWGTAIASVSGSSATAVSGTLVNAPIISLVVPEPTMLAGSVLLPLLTGRRRR